MLTFFVLGILIVNISFGLLSNTKQLTERYSVYSTVKVYTEGHEAVRDENHRDTPKGVFTTMWRPSSTASSEKLDNFLVGSCDFQSSSSKSCQNYPEADKPSIDGAVSSQNY